MIIDAVGTVAGKAMLTLLARNADVLVTMDADRREIPGGGLFARDGVIETVGTDETLPRQADRVIDLSGRIVVPGLINTHHHLFQTLTRAIPAAQDALLFDWLKTLYPVWSRLTPEAIEISTLTGLAELALSGCTTSSDHLYVFPNGIQLEDQIAAAERIGMRFHAMRGSMSIGESAGGLPPDTLVEDEAVILADSQRLIEAYHDPSPYAMIRIGLAPCSPFSVSQDLMRETAALARSAGVRLHTHLAENAEDVAYSVARFGRRPADYAGHCGWLDDDVWFAHCVRLDPCDAARLAACGAGIAHCPTSNMRLGSGTAPLRRWLEAGVAVGLGVDGSASNDSSDLLTEARQAMLLQRVAGGADALSARQALETATLGGARVLGRDDVGALAPGMAADFAAFDRATLGLAGAGGDPVAALLFCRPGVAETVVVQGTEIVSEGRLASLELSPLIEGHNRIAQALLAGD